MKTCPYCAEQIPDAAVVCQFCNRDLGSDASGVATAPRTRSAIGTVVMGGLVIVMVIGIASSLTPEPSADASRRDAALICHRFVRERLRAPTSAKFPTTDESVVEPISDGDFEVRSYVDSQNGFGAMLRSKYVCTVKPVAGDRWRLMDLKIDSK